MPVWALVCLLAQAQSPFAVRLYPVDDTARDPEFRSYVKRLQAAVEARDARALRRLVDDEVVTGPTEEDTGWDKFTENWRPQDKNSSLWSALGDMLSLGFVREHPSVFVSPYLVWRFPDNLPMRAHLVVIRDKVPLRNGASLRAPVVAWLSFDVVRRRGDAQRGEELAEWTPVETLGGQAGFVNTRDVMSPLMPRAQFGMRGGRWKMVGLEAPGA